MTDLVEFKAGDTVHTIWDDRPEAHGTILRLERRYGTDGAHVRYPKGGMLWKPLTSLVLASEA